MRAYHLPLKYGLIERMQAYGQECIPTFRDVRECPVDFIKIYEAVWKVRKQHLTWLSLHDDYHHRLLNEEVWRNLRSQLAWWKQPSLSQETTLMSATYKRLCLKSVKKLSSTMWHFLHMLQFTKDLKWWSCWSKKEQVSPIVPFYVDVIIIFYMTMSICCC